MNVSSDISYPTAGHTREDAIKVRALITDSHVLVAGSLILLLPNLLFAIHLQPVGAAIMGAGAIGMVALTLAGRPLASDALLSRAMSLPRLGFCLALAVAMLVLGGEAHLLFANWDWLWRDAVLSDLARAPFPPTYQIADQTFVLRAPLGMYMLPALVAQATNLATGHAALLVQNAVLLTFCLYMLATIAGQRAILVVAIFLSFSGLDALGQMLRWLSLGHDLATFTLPSHIEQWTGLQYSSVVTQVFWVPNHALPAYWVTLLAMLCARREIGLDTLGVSLAASLFWSPFAVLGTLPFAIYLFLRDARAWIVAPSFWLAVVVSLCFLPVAAFLSLDAAQVPHQLLLLDPATAVLIAIFLMIEIPHVACVGQVFGALDPWLKPILLVAVLVLVALPAFKVGQANDLVMRASIPALMILAFGFAQSLAICWRRQWAVFALGMVTLAVGAITPFQEVRRSLTVPSYAISTCTLTTVWKHFPVVPTLDNYLARSSTVPGWLLASASGPALTTTPDATCWPDIPYDPVHSLSPGRRTPFADKY